MPAIKYKLRIKGLKTADGTISVQALKDLLDLLLENAERALRLAIQGESVKRARKPSWLVKSLDLVVTGIEQGSTVLDIETPTLGDTAADEIKEQDLWYTRPRPEDTAFTLLSRSVKDTTSENLESDTYDAGVLDGLISFKPFLQQFAEEIDLESTDRPQEQFELSDKEIEKNERIKTRTPEPTAFVISGLFDLIQHSKKQFHLVLSNGQVILGTVDPEFLTIEDMRQWWGRKVTVKGTVHFRPSGRVRLIEAHVIKPMEAGEEIFERLPEPPTALELFDASAKREAAKSPLMEVWNKWPGDESIDEILAALKEG